MGRAAPGCHWHSMSVWPDMRLYNFVRHPLEKTHLASRQHITHQRQHFFPTLDRCYSLQEYCFLCKSACFFLFLRCVCRLSEGPACQPQMHMNRRPKWPIKFDDKKTKKAMHEWSNSFLRQGIRSCKRNPRAKAPNIMQHSLKCWLTCTNSIRRVVK